MRRRKTNYILKSLVALMICGGISLGYANATERYSNQQGAPEFEFLGQKLDSDYLTMDYKLPYGGVVELRVFGMDGGLIWQNQYIHPRGENQIRLKAEAFETGNTYTIQLNYKTEEFKLQVERK